MIGCKRPVMKTILIDALDSVPNFKNSRNTVKAQLNLSKEKIRMWDYYSSKNIDSGNKR
jgi:hypothetical protein